MHKTGPNSMHATHLNRPSNTPRALKHTYFLCKPAGVGGEEALNAGCPPPPTLLAWLDGTDWSIPTGEELARDGETTGEGDVGSPAEYMSAHYGHDHRCKLATEQICDTRFWRFGWFTAVDLPLRRLFCMRVHSLIDYIWCALTLVLLLAVCFVCSACKRSGHTQISYMHDVRLTHVTVGSPPQAPMWLLIHAHVPTSRWSCETHLVAGVW